jgi:hypothetical protein
MPVLLLLVSLFVVGLAIAGLLWVGTLFLQGYIYSEPTPALHWRAPAVAGALFLLLLVWCLLDYRLYDPTAGDELPLDTPFRITVSRYDPPTVAAQIWARNKEGKETLYKWQRKAGVGREEGEYVNPANNNRPWSRDASGLLDAIIVEENGKKVTYKLIPPEKGKFKENEEARYQEEGGTRVLTESDVKAGARRTTFRLGLVVANVILNVLHFGLWFAGLWLLLRYQWAHALGLAVVLWVVMTLAVLPLVFDRAKEAAKASPRPPARTQVNVIGNLWAARNHPFSETQHSVPSDPVVLHPSRAGGGGPPGTVRGLYPRTALEHPGSCPG